MSGGLDSGVAAALWLRDHGELALVLTVDYGQRAFEPERRAARALAQRWGVPWRAIEMPWLGEAADRFGSALTATEQNLPDPLATSSSAPEVLGDDDSARAVWVPARNVVLLAAAAALAEAQSAQAVVAGFNREEAATFADNSAQFLADMTAALARGTRNGVVVASPTLELDKPQIVAAARSLGLDRGSFWSCYTAGPEACGRCESCRRSERAWGSSAR